MQGSTTSGEHTLSTLSGIRMALLHHDHLGQCDFLTSLLSALGIVTVNHDVSLSNVKDAQTNIYLHQFYSNFQGIF